MRGVYRISSLTVESPLPRGEIPRKAEFIFPPKRCEWPILSSLIIYEAFFEVPLITFVVYSDLTVKIVRSSEVLI